MANHYVILAAQPKRLIALGVEGGGSGGFTSTYLPDVEASVRKQEHMIYAPAMERAS